MLKNDSVHTVHYGVIRRFKARGNCCFSSVSEQQQLLHLHSQKAEQTLRGKNKKPNPQTSRFMTDQPSLQQNLSQFEYPTFSIKHES